MSAFHVTPQVERFLDTENAALISMHYPQAQREVHFGTAPFDKTGHGETEDDGEEYGEIEDESEARGLGAVGSQGEGGTPDGEALAGEEDVDAPGRSI